jgi:hypothetical protein
MYTHKILIVYISLAHLLGKKNNAADFILNGSKEINNNNYIYIHTHHIYAFMNELSKLTYM